MFCPICKAEFREGFTECRSCQVKLVEDLLEIKEQVAGEFLLCTACENEYESGSREFCQDCGLKLVRAVLQDDVYVFLNAPEHEYAEEEGLDMPEFKHLTRLNEDESVILIESEDLEMLIRIQQLLDENKIPFDMRIPESEMSKMQAILGAGNPLEREFPRILVRPENEEAAIKIITADEKIGLGGLPPELEEDYEDEDDDDADGYDKDEY